MFCMLFTLKMLKLRGPVPTPRSNQQPLKHSPDTPAAVVSRYVAVLKLYLVFLCSLLHAYYSLYTV